MKIGNKSIIKNGTKISRIDLVNHRAMTFLCEKFLIN